MKRIQLGKRLLQKTNVPGFLSATRRCYRNASFDLDLCQIKVQEIPVKTELRKHSAVHYKGKIIIFGGEDKQYNQLNQVDIFNLKTEEYRKAVVSGVKPSPMKCHSATVVVEMGIMLVFGGTPNAKGAVYSLDLRRMIWSRLNNVFYDRVGHSASLICNSVYLYGGYQ